VDVVWSFALGVAGVGYALYPLQSGPPTARQCLIALLAACWSLRLGLHIARRTSHGTEDVRYAQFRRDWGNAFQRHMFWFLQIQAAAAALLAVSMLLAARTPRPLSTPDVIAVGVLALSIIGEAVADRQLQGFRSNPVNRSRVCDVGLWGWSRHPNYFFEWIVWFAYPMMAISTDDPVSWLSLIAPALMFVVLRFGTGVPPLETSMAASRGKAFDDYKAKTSTFLLLPPRKKVTDKTAARKSSPKPGQRTGTPR
jgi:steroid 5-alpha reductase family enzyme